MAALYIFNPEHDYALANNDPHFMPPASAVKFALDCALFLSYIVPEDASLFLPHSTNDKFYSIKDNSWLSETPDFQSIQPWGWDALVLHQCQEHFPSQSLEYENKVITIRRLAHRRNTIAAMEYLKRHCPDEIHLPEPALELFSTDEIEEYIRKYQHVIFKSPYSGNGRGHLYAHERSNPTLLRQGGGVIRRQGSIMAEPLYEVVQDFAMEFRCHNGQTEFSGYSLFNTLHYGYAGNLLLTDTQIEARLIQWVPEAHLHAIQDHLRDYITHSIAPFYEGYLGVDMFVYQKDNRSYFNPMVEMNLRMTMGLAAHILVERYLHPEAKGIMRLEYQPKFGRLLQQIQNQEPLTIKAGKWHHGFLALNPVTEETQYAITINITNI
ncbi:MAG: hypothetical protein II865_10670 [Bacteroidales bacterium]|nr:hypothetical protein [Bacteroidales bacterium]